MGRAPGTVRELPLSWRARVDPVRVGALLRDVAREEIAPRFRALSREDVHVKATAWDASDVVTEADLAIERRLEPALRALVPGSAVVGEEAVAAEPARLGVLEGDAPIWVVDPIDGTKNFAAGRDVFGSMLALSERGTPRFAWIYLFAADALFTAEAGAGAWRDGRRLRTTPPDAGAAIVGTVSPHLPAETQLAIGARLTARVTAVPCPGSAAVEYTRLAEGAQDFGIHGGKLLPWDHAPGVLLVTEAGGMGKFVDGRAYRAVDTSRPLLVARHASTWDDLRAALFPDATPPARRARRPGPPRSRRPGGRRSGPR